MQSLADTTSDRQMRSSGGVVRVRNRTRVDDTTTLVRYSEAGREISGAGTSLANVRPSTSATTVAATVAAHGTADPATAAVQARAARPGSSIAIG